MDLATKAILFALFVISCIYLVTRYHDRKEFDKQVAALMDDKE